MRKSIAALNILLASLLLTGCLSSDSDNNKSGSTPPADTLTTEEPTPTTPNKTDEVNPLPSNNVGNGNWNLRVTTTVMGTATPSELTNVAKPATQAEFCNNQEVVNSYEQMSQAGATWQQNSCTFDGTNGKINATMNIMGMGISYTVDYYYYR